MASDLYSHPGKLLEDHINGCLKIFSSIVLKRFDNIDNRLKDTAIVAISSHDIGKATNYFQDYILGKGSVRNDLKKHSLLSSIFSFLATKELVEDEKFAIMSFIAVKRHHSDLYNNIRDELNFYGSERKEDVIKLLSAQIKSIDEKKFLVFIDALNLPCSYKDVYKNVFERFLSDPEGFVNNFNENDILNARFLVRRAFDSVSFDDYFNFMFIFSSLVYVDKKEATNTYLDVPYLDIDESVVENYKKKKFSSCGGDLDRLREKAYNEVLGNDVDRLIDEDRRVFSITLPTGMGKTLTGFSFALKLRKELKKRGKEFKVIYSLPFLSIIDQNFDVILDVLREGGVKTSSSNILKHHHLSELKYYLDDKSVQDDEEGGINYDSAKMLIESWDSNIVITTFIQFFHSLLTSSNSMSRRFVSIAKSIVILDEIQTIPYEFWKVIEDFIKEYAKRFDVYVILMTATKPCIFEDAFELTQSNYFNHVDRVRFKFLNVDKSISEFSDFIFDKFYNEVEGGKRLLVICNTINSSHRIYELLKEKFGEVGYLSSAVVPKERLQRIKEIKDGRYRVVVSTQVVEAGVDIDFDIVFRDFAPMDALIQSSGRCNRNSRGTGEFLVLKLFDNKNNKKEFFYEKIYDEVLCKSVEDVFNIMSKGFLEFNEAEFKGLIDSYFSVLNGKKSNNKSLDLIKSLKSLDFNSISKNFKLIKGNVYKSDVFIELDDEASEVWNELGEIEKLVKSGVKQNIFEAKRRFDEIKSCLYQYVVSVDSRKSNLEVGYFGILYLSKDNLSHCYEVGGRGYIGFSKEGYAIW